MLWPENNWHVTSLDCCEIVAPSLSILVTTYLHAVICIIAERTSKLYSVHVGVHSLHWVRSRYRVMICRRGLPHLPQFRTPGDDLILSDPAYYVHAVHAVHGKQKQKTAASGGLQSTET